MSARHDLPRLLTRASASECGLTPAAVRHRMNTRGWQLLTPGVLLTSADPPTRWDWADLGLLLAGSGSALSGWDAVNLVDTRLAAVTEPDAEILVLVKHGHNRVIGRVRIRVTRRAYRIRRIFLDDSECPRRVVRPARAIADTALTQHSLRPVRALVTGAVQRSLCPAGELIDELSACPRNGSRLLRRALADVLDGAASTAEAEAVDELRLSAVPPFELNVPLLRADGVLDSVADVYWRELRAVLEVDSREYHFDEASWNRTMTRHNRLTAAGLAVTHYSPSRIRSGALRRDVEPWLRSRARELDVGYEVDARPVRRPSGVALPFYLP